jgi:6,7-dimethyl-8-ribityllumazine synthase
VKPKRGGNGKRPQPAPQCGGRRFAIVAARFYRELSDWLIDGARRALADCGVHADDVDFVEVPGCFELPLACRNLIEANRYDGIVALGVVIRGETPHFDFVAGQCARGIMDVQLATSVPVGFGVLTTDTLAQAQERADPARGDKGYEAAIAAATLVNIPAKMPRAGFRA